MNYSPLRYPGGKSKLTSLVETLMRNANIVNGTYIEPFVGGGGIALSLIINGKVSRLVLNDFDIAIFSVWNAILNDTERFVAMINNAELTIDEWRRQKEVYLGQHTRYSIELAFATFYLNRTNRSGILKAGPIGGYKQDGNYRMDARFNKQKLIERIQLIATFRENILIYHMESRRFIEEIIPLYTDNSFTYFDPPYYKKGKELYKNFFVHSDHVTLSDMILNVESNWMITYDDVAEIVGLYSNNYLKRFDINYSVANKGKKSEIIALSTNFWPRKSVLRKMKLNIR